MMEEHCVPIDISAVVGGSYGKFWYSKKRYRIIKGSRGSKKSCTVALWIIYHIAYFFHTYKLKPNVLVIRRYYYTNRQSTRSQLIWAIQRLGLTNSWTIPRGEFTLTYKPSGQRIIFRGLDDPQSITSMTVSDGFLCWVWFEEFSQIDNEEDFNKIDLSIRGMLPEPLFKSIIMTMNPWSEAHFAKKRFFDNADDAEIDCFTTNYLCNEWLGEDDLRLFEEMRIHNPRRYQVEGLGEWGIPGDTLLNTELLVRQRIEEFPEDVQWFRVWDLAHTARERIKDDPDWTAGTLLAFNKIDSYWHLWIKDVVRMREAPPSRDKKIITTAIKDGAHVRIAIEESVDSKDAYAYLKETLQGRRMVEAVHPKGDKVMRVTPLEPLFATGRVHVPLNAEWVPVWIAEIASFPYGSHDDQVDNLSAGYRVAIKEDIYELWRL
jgi:predicted phage terminase large subunit-like protein